MMCVVQGRIPYTESNNSYSRDTKTILPTQAQEKKNTTTNTGRRNLQWERAEQMCKRILKKGKLFLDTHAAYGHIEIGPNLVVFGGN